jgi:hypothetical protein
MHYEVSYRAHEDVAAADAAAIADIRDWLGAERFATVDSVYRQLSEPVSLDLFRLQMSFAGIQGYPVAAWYRSLWPDTAA